MSVCIRKKNRFRWWAQRGPFVGKKRAPMVWHQDSEGWWGRCHAICRKPQGALWRLVSYRWPHQRVERPGWCRHFQRLMVVGMICWARVNAGKYPSTASVIATRIPTMLKMFVGAETCVGLLNMGQKLVRRSPLRKKPTNCYLRMKSRFILLKRGSAWLDGWRADVVVADVVYRKLSWKRWKERLLGLSKQRKQTIATGNWKAKLGAFLQGPFEIVKQKTLDFSDVGGADLVYSSTYLLNAWFSDAKAL